MWTSGASPTRDIAAARSSAGVSSPSSRTISATSRRPVASTALARAPSGSRPPPIRKTWDTGARLVEHAEHGTGADDLAAVRGHRAVGEREPPTELLDLGARLEQGARLGGGQVVDGQRDGHRARDP